MGTQHARKNIELIISAMDKLSVEIDLVVAGRNTSHTARLKRTAKRLSLGDRVHFLDSVTKDELAAIYRGALMLIYPTHYSSFGMPIIEAMSVGIPVIGATGSSHEEAGGNAAIYVSPNDSDALAERIEELLDALISVRGTAYYWNHFTSDSLLSDCCLDFFNSQFFAV